MTMGIYQIFCWANGKFYIGSAINIEQRWRCHRSDLKLKKHGSITLQRAWEKYGAKLFTFKVLEIVSDKFKLIEREQFWFDSLKPFNPHIGYNINPTAGSRLGTKENPEITIQRAAKLKGRKQSPEEIAKRVASNTGKKRTQETKNKMSNSRKRRIFKFIHTEEAKIKIGIASKIRRAEATRLKNIEFDKMLSIKQIKILEYP